MIRTLIVDDEYPARELLARYVDELVDFQLVGEASDGRRAVEAIRTARPDVVLLDVQMPKLDGFQVLATLRREAVAIPRVVFVTAYDRYAVRAFEWQALDYLLKPVTRPRFAQAVELVRTTLGRTLDVDELLGHVGTPSMRFILVKAKGTIVRLPVESIDWIEGQGDYARLHLGDRSHLVERTLSDLADRLGAAQFARVHRSSIVNLARVVEIERLGSARLRLRLSSGAEVMVSRSYRREVEALMGAR